MGTNNICFHWEIRKISAFFGWKRRFICCYGISNKVSTNIHLKTGKMTVWVRLDLYLNVEARNTQGEVVGRETGTLVLGFIGNWSLGMSIMRVDSWELPLSAVPLCQLLPCHLGPPRPTLSIDLYVTGCLDCTIGVFHMSILVEPSLLQNEVQIPKDMYELKFHVSNHKCGWNQKNWTS